MSNYDKAIRTVTEVKPLTSHMASLGKIMATSDDMQLTNLIANLVMALQYQHQHSTAKSTPTSLRFHPIPQTISLIDYCNYQNRQKKPEWQVIAESNGWSPAKR